MNVFKAIGGTLGDLFRGGRDDEAQTQPVKFPGGPEGGFRSMDWVGNPGNARLQVQDPWGRSPSDPAYNSPPADGRPRLDAGMSYPIIEGGPGVGGPSVPFGASAPQQPAMGNVSAPAWQTNQATQQMAASQGQGAYGQPQRQPTMGTRIGSAPQGGTLGSMFGAYGAIPWWGGGQTQQNTPTWGRSSPTGGGNFMRGGMW